MSPISQIDPLDAPKTLVLIDPTSPQGESALAQLTDDDRHVALVVLMAGPTAAALRQYAEAENIDVSTAADIYLDQVAERVTKPGRVVEVVKVAGYSAAAELADLAAMGPTKRTLSPSPVAAAPSDSAAPDSPSAGSMTAAGLAQVRRQLGRLTGIGRAA
jgi:hypothetical protein